jgi:hypothetical protein
MNKNLNFVFFSDSLEHNGVGSYGILGPLFNYITRLHTYSYTLNCEIKDGYKNIIMIEPIGTTYGTANIPNEDIEKIKNILNKGAKLLIVSLADPSNTHAFETCLEFLKDKNLIEDLEIKNQKNVIFLDSNLRYKDSIYVIDYFIEEGTWNKDTFYNNENSLGYISEPIKESELNTFKTRKFISFNRNNDKIHRFYLLKEYLTGNYSDSYFSFLMYITEYNDLLMVGDMIEQEMISKNIESYNSLLPIELDTHNITDKSSFSVMDTFKKELFLDSCINLVTESSFVGNELFLSEKILKPILSYQPFIVFGPYGYLNRLKEYGFKTFSDFWDEGYDNIESPHDRIDVLINLVRTLNNLSIEEMNELYQKTKNICIYNRELFYSLKVDSINKILNKIENEW